MCLLIYIYIYIYISEATGRRKGTSLVVDKISAQGAAEACY